MRFFLILTSYRIMNIKKNRLSRQATGHFSLYMDTWLPYSSPLEVVHAPRQRCYSYEIADTVDVGIVQIAQLFKKSS